MCRTRLLAVGLAVVLLAVACGGDEDHDPAERENETSSGFSVTSEAESAQDGHAGASTTPAKEPQQVAAPAVAAPVQLGERFGWCAKVQALWDAQDQARTETEAAAAVHEAAVRAHEAATDDLDRAEAGEAVYDAYAEYVFSTRDYGQVRWHAAALIFSDEPTLLGGGLEDSTPQVAIERAREAYRANAAPHTLAALDYAHEATEIAARSSTDERSEGDQSGPAIEAPEPDPAPFDASEAWLRATEALQDALNGVEDAEVASDNTSKAAAAAQAAKNEAEDAAWAIYRAAFFDGEWEALIRDVEAHLAAAAAGAMSIHRNVTEVARAVEEAAWYVARISADLDTSAVAAFKESLQQSCR